jgi:hypothetical protein
MRMVGTLGYVKRTPRRARLAGLAIRDFHLETRW